MFQTIAYSSSAIERVFSHSNRVLTRDRNRLSPQMVDAICFLNGNSDILETVLPDVANAFYLPLRTPSEELRDATANSSTVVQQASSNAQEEIIDWTDM